jgi:hypothetical protein
MNEVFFADLSAWLTRAGLAGTPETEVVSVFCDRCVAAGIPLARAGASLLRRRLNADTKDEFSMLADWLAAGMTDYVGITTRLAAEGVIGEMDASTNITAMY